MRKLGLLFILLIPLIGFSNVKQIRVGVYESPPFVIQKDSGKYEGLCIDLLKYLEENMDIEFVINQYQNNIPELISKVENNDIDMVVGSMTINSERLKMIDFSQPYFVTNLAIAQISKQASYIKTILTLFSLGTLRVISWLVVLLFIMGIIFWNFERGKNPMFRKSILGIFDGFYYAIVVMTTVGFGDKVTITPYGRTVTVLWMLVYTWVMSFFVAGITSMMTVERMNDVIDNVQDLKVTKVASIVGTTSGKFLEENGVRYIMYKNVKEGLDAITNGELETFVYDSPILKYYMKDIKYSNLVLSNKRYEPQYYGFGLKRNFKYEDEMNTLILEYINSSEWDNNLRKYNLND